MTLESLGYSAAQNNIIRLIYKNPGITRKDLANLSGISGRTILKFVSDFIEKGIVTNSEKNKSTGGRNAERLMINPDFMYVLAVDIGSYSTKIGLVNMNGDVIDCEFLIRKENNKSADITPEELKDHLQNYIDKYKKERLLGIGIGITGLVSKAGKYIEFSPNIPKFNNIDITCEFENYLSLDVTLDTSARCLALAEQRYGLGKGYDNQVFVSLGHSISAGIIVNGEIFGGSNGIAGEIGHTKCANNGTRCSCGNYDCLEVYSTLPMIVSNVKRELKAFSGYSPILNLAGSVDNVTWEHIARGAELKDRLAGECINNAGERIGFALSHMINSLNPEIIIFGGSVTELLPGVVDKAISCATEFSLISSVQNLKMVKSELGNKGAIMGCAVGVMNHYFGV